MRCVRGFAALLGVLLAAGVASAAEEAGRLETKVTRVALFKNGLGFFVREGKLPSARVVRLSGFAAPAHGTFWFSYPEGLALESIVGRETTETERIPVASFAELLSANEGKEVVVLGSGEKIMGRLVSLPKAPESPAPDAYSWGRGAARSSSFISPVGSQSRLALIQTAEGLVAIDPQSIRQVNLPGEERTLTLPREVKSWEIEARLKRPAAGTPVAASYLAKGITWAPSYVVDISDPSQARLTAKAVVINEAEDLKGTHLDLITGFPNLGFADIADPLAGKESLAGFLASLARGSSQAESRRGIMAQNAMFAGVAELGREALFPEYGAAAVGKTVEDLFFYPVEQVTLGKGETGYYPLFTASVPYKQIYQWEIPDYINREDRYGDPRREQREAPEEVWHSIKLTNKTKTPWTTAPAQTMKAGQILGQDTLKYTPSAATSLLRITQAISIKAEQSEREISRERDAVQLYGDHFDRVTIEGRLRVVNFKAEAVTMEITKNLSGELKQTSPKAEVERLARGLERMNPTNLLTWSFTLKPGEQKELTYSYEALIRR
jgi:hypothetical protein